MNEREQLRMIQERIEDASGMIEERFGALIEVVLAGLIFLSLVALAILVAVLTVWRTV